MQIRNPQTVKKIDKEKRYQDKRQEVKISDSYVEFNDDFIQMLPDFESMWHEQLSQISIAKQRAKLSPSDAKSIHSAQYWAGPKARKFEKHEIDKMLSEGVLHPDQTKWAAPIVFAAKKDGTLGLFVDYRKLNAVTK